MIDGLVAGKLYGQPKQKTGSSGRTFVIAKVRAAAGESGALFVNIIAFDEQPKIALSALEDGDSVALSGPLTPKVWTDRDGASQPSLDMVAHVVLTAYHVKRRRRAVRETEGDSPRSGGRRATGDTELTRQTCGAFDDVNDDL